ncbi:MAG: tRNA lysidine(34) synthetase TilS [Candidatus Omnitrophica bacterium]|nr:tRNA lysidine(34) synthetase TilS [Candidatus Omnitrophota bacterium]
MTAAPSLLGSARSAVKKHRMLSRGERVLVGVSGGPDSLALLSALVGLAPELGVRLRACYVDHGLRPAAGRRERETVQRYARIWGVPVSTIKVRVARRGGQSLEAAARRARYDALCSQAKRLRCGVVAVGHTADDQAETVLMWVLRGAGTAGLAGIPPVRELSKGIGYRVKNIRLVRPLIDCTRTEVQTHLKKLGVRPVSDESNRSTRFTRNRIRHELIGQLERNYNPRLREHLCATAEVLRADLDWLEDQTRAEFRRIARVSARGIRLDRARLRRLHPALRRGLLREAVRRLQGDRAGFGYAHWRALETLVLNGVRGAADLPHGLRAEVLVGGKLFFRRSALSRRKGSGTLNVQWPT